MTKPEEATTRLSKYTQYFTLDHSLLLLNWLAREALDNDGPVVLHRLTLFRQSESKLPCSHRPVLSTEAKLIKLNVRAIMYTPAVNTGMKTSTCDKYDTSGPVIMWG